MLEYITRGLREAAELFNQKGEKKDTVKIYSSRQLRLPEPKLYAMVTGLSQTLPTDVKSVKYLSDLYVTKSNRAAKSPYSVEVQVEYFNFKMSSEEIRGYLEKERIPKRFEHYQGTDLLYYALFVNAKRYLWDCRKEGHTTRLTYEEDILWLCDLFWGRGIFVEILEQEDKKMSIVEAFSYEEDIREAGMEEGLQKGIEKGIVGSIKLLGQIGLESSLIKKKIIEQYSLTEEEAAHYMKL